MPWEKNTPEAVARFDELVAVEGAKRGILFGCPVYELDGERYATLHQGRIALRLSPEDAAALVAKGGVPFEPMPGRRSSKGRIVVPDEIAANARSLKSWVKKAVDFAKNG